jgi:hypothetical protein
MVVNIHFSTASVDGQKTSIITVPNVSTALRSKHVPEKPEILCTKGMQTTNKNYISRYCGSATGALCTVLQEVCRFAGPGLFDSRLDQELT